MSSGVVGASRSRFHLARSWIAIALGLAAPLAAAQDVVTRPRTPSPTPQDPPLVTPRPDFVVREGHISAGMTGKLVLTREMDFSKNLHSSLSGAMALDSPGEWNRAGDVGVRKGFLLWTLRDRSGCQGVIGVIGDPSSSTIHGTLEAPLPAAIRLEAHGQSRWSRTQEGDVRVDHASLGLRRQLARALVVQPRVSLYDVRARDAAGWMGSHLRIEYRGAELALNHEGVRGSSATTRKTWHRGDLQWTLGGQIERHPGRADRSLLECAVTRERLGIRLYPGDAQRGILLHAGAISVGFGQRPQANFTVIGFKNVSMSMQAHEDGRREVGFGFVYGGLLRGVSQTSAGWQWRPAYHHSAIEDPRLRWPGLATLAN